jgi:murein DD-endopeptidase MepM/ murein hydrolase activator NlpD
MVVSAPMAAEDRPPRRRTGIFLGVLGSAGFGWLFWYATVGHHVELPVAPATQSSTLQASAHQQSAPLASQTQPPSSPARPASEQYQTTTTRLDRDQTLGQVLPRLKLTAAEAAGVLAALESHFPARRARTGDQLIVERRAGDPALLRFTYRQGRADEYVVTRGAGAWVATRRPVELKIEVSRISVEVKDSLYLSLRDAGEDPSLAVLASDVLAWDVDFYRDVRDGDRMTVLVEKTIADGRRLRYGEIQAVEYLGKTAGRKRLFRWTAPDGLTSYFDDDGQSARRGFLKTPLKFAHVTSGYGNRSHPLLGYQSAHTGVDYGAPPGTPVWAVGDGVVKQAGWNGGCGLSVTIRHPNGLETLYCHLSAVSVSPGKPVTQKQSIGAVGSTGLSTGPHLHYAVLRGGAYMNPGQLKVPRDAPVRAAWLPGFQSDIAPRRALLDGVEVAVVGPSVAPTAMVPVRPGASGGGGGAPAPR